MNTYRICMKVEQDGPAEQDMEIVRVVQAAGDSEAVENARLLLGTKQQEINVAKVWAWSSELIRSPVTYKSK